MGQLHVNLYGGQGLGNQLWVIFSCIGLSLKLGRVPVIYGAEFFKGFGFIKINVEFLEGKSPTKISVQEKKRFDLIFGLDQTNHNQILADICNFPEYENILLVGDLQSMSLLPDPLEKILDFFCLEFDQYYPFSDSIAVHLRGGDYSQTICQPTSQYYLSALNYVKNLDIYSDEFIITDDLILAKKFFPGVRVESQFTSNRYDLRRASHHQGGCIQHDFAMLLYAKASIISASTFSFWAALIGKIMNKEKLVIAPLYWYANRVSRSWWSLPDSYCQHFIYLNKFGSEYQNFYLSRLPRIQVKSDIYPPFRNIFNRIIRLLL